MKLVYTAQSSRNFHQRMLICKHVFERGYGRLPSEIKEIPEPTL